MRIRSLREHEAMTAAAEALLRASERLDKALCESFRKVHP